jgi:multidrug efflux pump subunit AcrA (membrane-fusion protein)
VKKIITLLALIVISFISFWLWKRKDFIVVTPHKGNVLEAIYALGKVKSHKTFDVLVGVMSVVQEIYVEEGDEVKVGDPLIKFDTGAAFKAPFSGTVTLVKVRKREIALPHAPVLRIVDVNDRYIELTLEQDAALRLRKGQNAKVSFESMRAKTISGIVIAVFSREDEFLAHVTVPKLDPSILPGMTADVTVEIGRIENALLIPYKTVSNGMVTVKRNNQWKKEKLEIGHFDGTFVEVKDDSIKVTDEIRMPKD